MNAGMQVRDAREEDLPRILVLLYQLSQSSSNPEPSVRPLTDRHRDLLRTFLNDPHCRLLVLEDDGQVQGTLASLSTTQHVEDCHPGQWSSTWSSTRRCAVVATGRC